MFVFGSGVFHKACLYSDARTEYRACIALGFESSSRLVVSVLFLGRSREGGAGEGFELLWDEMGVVSLVYLVSRGCCLRFLGLGVFGLREGRLLGEGGEGVELVGVCSCCLERLRGLTFLGGGGGSGGEGGGVLGWELVDCVCVFCC